MVSQSEFNGPLIHVLIHNEGFENGDILAWISPVNFCAKHIDILNRRQEGTGQWLLGTDEFDGWVTGRERTLWCPGIRTSTNCPT